MSNTGPSSPSSRKLQLGFFLANCWILKINNIQQTSYLVSFYSPQERYKETLNTYIWLILARSSPPLACDKDESGRCLPDQSGTLYFHYSPRLVWEGLARLIWQLIFSLLPQISLESTCQTSLEPHIFTISPRLV